MSVQFILYLRGPIIDTYACLTSGCGKLSRHGLLGSPLKGRPSQIHTYDLVKQTNNNDSLLLLNFPTVVRQIAEACGGQR